MEQNNPKEKQNETTNYEKGIAMKVSAITVIINLLLSALKLAAGIFAHSGAMISDAVHSASDVLSTFVVMLGVSLANKQSDDEHPYGHERLECVASLLLAILLAITGLGIGFNGIEKILGKAGPIAIPGEMALLAAIISILVKEWMYWYTRAAAKKIKSGALMADAWHHRSDALSSIGALIGIGGAILGYPILEPIASVVICIFIEKVAIDIFRDSMDKMVDKSGSKALMVEMASVIAEQDGVEGVDNLKTRMFGAKIYVDVEIAADGSLTLTQAHKIAESVHSAIEENFPEVKHCMVHVNPAEKIE